MTKPSDALPGAMLSARPLDRIYPAALMPWNSGSTARIACMSAGGLHALRTGWTSTLLYP